jgi:hypothetical protein
VSVYLPYCRYPVGMCPLFPQEIIFVVIRLPKNTGIQETLRKTVLLFFGGSYQQLGRPRMLSIPESHVLNGDRMQKRRLLKCSCTPHARRKKRKYLNLAP